MKNGISHQTPMGYGRPQNKSTYLKSSDLWWGCQKYMLEKRQPFQQMLGKVNIHMQKTETRSLSLTLYKISFKMDHRC
jgi:hypothetical protein